MKQLSKYWIVILSLIMIVFVIFGFREIEKSAYDQQRESLEKALGRGVLECYAQEGRYPESLDYLLENYHIVYDEERFDVKYEVIASNIIPNIIVIAK